MFPPQLGWTWSIPIGSSARVRFGISLDNDIVIDWWSVNGSLKLSVSLSGDGTLFLYGKHNGAEIYGDNAPFQGTFPGFLTDWLRRIFSQKS